MGGIFGIFARGNAVAGQDLLDALDATLAHRGQDVVGTWQGEGIGLGLRLGHTTPESVLEAPPRAAGHGGRLVLVGDCRIDNRDELSLQLGGGFVEPCSDSDLVLGAYERWGVECVDHLIGDFTFALYDGARDEVFCVRDHFGVKPFCYSLSCGRFVFASEARPLVASGLVAGALNEERIADFLLRRFEDKVPTFYRDVRRLPPAHAMVVGRGDVRIWQYWQPSIDGPGSGLGDEEANARFRQLFDQAVECRVRSIHPVGSFLSGGLDSSAVTLVANRVLPESLAPLHAFSTVFPSVPRSDESNWMALASLQAEADGRPLHRYLFHGDETGPLEVMEEMVSCLGAPSPAANLFQSWGMLGMARDAGVRVMLTGHDGDTVVSHGFALLTELALKGEWQELETELGRISRMLEAYGNVRSGLARMHVQPAPALLWKSQKRLQAVRAFQEIHRRFGISRKAMLTGFRGWGWLASFGLKSPIFGDRTLPEVSKEFSLSGAFRARAGIPPTPCSPSVAVDHLRGVESGLITAAFEEFDLISAAFGVESRHPFFDKRLVEFCLSLPTCHKIRAGWTRVVLRAAMSGVVPEEILRRPDKSNLSHNFVARMGSERALAKLNELPGRYWNASFLQQAIGRIREAPAERDAFLIFLALGFGVWMRQYGESLTREFPID